MCPGLFLVSVEIELASVDYSRDRDKKKMEFPVVSVRSRGKRIGNYCTSSGIYTVDYCAISINLAVTGHGSFPNAEKSRRSRRFWSAAETIEKIVNKSRKNRKKIP